MTVEMTEARFMRKMAEKLLGLAYNAYCLVDKTLAIYSDIRDYCSLLAVDCVKG